jgi:hypothetical protein
LFAHHAACFEARFERKPVYTPGKDGAIFRALLRQLPLDDIVALLDQFFQSTDPFVLGSGYTVAVFASQINRLLVARRSGGNGRALPWTPFECPHTPKHGGRAECLVQTTLDRER